MVASRAAAYQSVGIAVSETWLGIAEDSRQSELFHVEQFDPALIAEWEPADWAQVYSIWIGWNRLLETLKLQIEGGLLPPDAASSFGFPPEQRVFPSPGYACLWPKMRNAVEPATREALDAAPIPVDCSELGVPVSLRAEGR